MKRLMIVLTSIVVCTLFTGIYSSNVSAATGNVPYKDVNQGIQSIYGISVKNITTDAGPCTNPEAFFKMELIEELSPVSLASYLSLLGELDPEDVEAAATLFAQYEKYKEQAIEKAKALPYDSRIDYGNPEDLRKIFPRTNYFGSEEEYKAFLKERQEQAEKDDGVSNDIKGSW